MRRTNFRLTLTAFLMSFVAMGATAQDVETALATFDKQQDVASANAFFGELQKAEFIDDMDVFGVDTPADSLRQQVWFWAAEWMYDQQEYEKAESYALKALTKYNPSNPEKADCLNTLGCIYVRLSDFKQAANYAKQSVEIEMRGGDHDRISSSLNTLAGIHMAAYQAKEAEGIILQALDHASKVDNPGRKAIILGMASEIYHALGNDEKALQFAEQAIELEKKLDRPQKLLIRLSQKGSALLGLHRYREAEAIFRDIIPQLKAMGDYHSYAIGLNRLGMALLCQERQQEAIPYYKEAASLFSQMGDLYNELHSHKGLYESYWDIHPDSAKQELDLFDLLKDSLYTNSTADALARYNAEFGNEQLQQENAEVRKAHRQTIVIGIALLLLAIAVAWFVMARHLRRWQKQMQELVKEVERLRTSTQQQEQTPAPSPTPVAADHEQENMTDHLFLLRVIEAVNEAMPHGNFGVEQIASKLNMSVQTFRRRLQDAAGEPPKAFIQAIQMERAIMLLKGKTDLPVAQVANLCGFDETSSFSHTFKRIYGCSPSEYRNKR